ncbi:MAG: dephospho-CoA kinase [Acidobacteriota bacterium]
MRPRALRVALTGGIATGKSHCLRRFVAKGAPVIDADLIAREVIAPGTAGADAVIARFGTLDRAAIGAVVFNDRQARADLEAIIHPRVFEAIDAWFKTLRNAPFGIADIPLLFETSRAAEFDRVIITSCAPEQQRERLLRRGSTPADAEARIGSQLSFEEKRTRARAAGVPVDVVDTSASPGETDAQVDRLIERLGSLPPRVCS